MYGIRPVQDWPTLGASWWLSGKEPTHHCRRHRFNPWFGKIPHATEQLSLYARTTEACVPWSPSAPQQEAHALQQRVASAHHN